MLLYCYFHLKCILEISNSAIQQSWSSPITVSISWIYFVVERVDMKIQEDMVGIRGAIMHDLCSKNGIHYLVVIAMYMKKVS